MSFASLILLQADGALPAFLFVFFLLFVGIFLLIVAAKTIKIVPQATVMLIERLGRFNRVASSGLNILVPFLDKARAVYWTNSRGGGTSIHLPEKNIHLPPQPLNPPEKVTIPLYSGVFWQGTHPI